MSGPPLTLVQNEQLRELIRISAHNLRDEVRKARETFIQRQSSVIVQRAGISQATARKIVEKLCHGILLPDVELQFDDPALSGNVRDILANPEAYAGATLSDPLEGPEYGRGVAKVMLRDDGTPWIHSFEHGRTVYELKHDARSIEEAVKGADREQAATLFISMLLSAEVGADEEQNLRKIVTDLSGIGAQPLKAMIKEARAKHKDAREREAKAREAVENSDGRVRLPVPNDDSEKTPVIDAIDEVLSNINALEPPMRDLDGRPTEVICRQAMQIHALTPSGANAEESQGKLPPALKFPLLTPHDIASMTRVVELHIRYIKETSRGEQTVALPDVFIDHYMRFRRSGLPRVGAVVTTPLVLGDGTFLANNGLDRERRIVFRIDPDVFRFMPDGSKCTPEHVRDAMAFLFDTWLADVAGGHIDKCVLIAATLTILERALLPQRPAFWVTAGQRGGGKTTTVSMIVAAATGSQPAAAASSNDVEERRKALFSYLLQGLPAIVWDNIPRGSAISCPHIERALTSETVVDRALGGSNASLEHFSS